MVVWCLVGCNLFRNCRPTWQASPRLYTQNKVSNCPGGAPVAISKWVNPIKAPHYISAQLKSRFYGPVTVYPVTHILDFGRNQPFMRRRMVASTYLDAGISECASLSVNTLHRSPVQSENGGWPQTEWSTFPQSCIYPVKNFVKLQKRVFSFQSSAFKLILNKYRFL